MGNRQYKKPEHAVVAVTEGLLDIMNREENDEIVTPPTRPWKIELHGSEAPRHRTGLQVTAAVWIRMKARRFGTACPDKTKFFNAPKFLALMNA